MQHSWGIIGVGQLGASLVEGLFACASPPRLRLSPRGESTVRALSRRFPVVVSANNQAVVDNADHVILAVRPDQLLELADSLRFQRGQVVVSVAAAVGRADIESATGPATVVRAMPVLSAALGDSPTCVYPESVEAIDLFQRLGPVHRFEEEQAFEVAAVAAMYYAWTHTLMDVCAAWLARNGVATQTGRTLIAQMTRAAAAHCLASDRDMAALAAEIARPGTFSALGLDRLHELGALDAWGDACQSVLDACRARGRR